MQHKGWVSDVRRHKDQVSQMNEMLMSEEKKRSLEAAKADFAMGLKHRETSMLKWILATMEKELIVGAIVAASLQVAIDRLASRPVLNFFRRRKLDDLRKLKEKLRTMVDNNAKAWLDEVKDALFDAEDPLNVIDYEFFECELEAEFESQTKEEYNLHQSRASQ
ncbi:hypothetical protein D0Y65_041805 [Glycine soja]|uniref:Uncharacterized protein n=1 Tax=Glycine soja TaxID=3848 RepID=A0A445GXA8_GLYSO|nr:hypothetical protein D0Y65_041805 [Glycine soja]